MCGYLHQLGQNKKNTLTFSYFVVLFVVVLLMAAYVVISQLLLLSSTSLLSSSSPDKNSLIRTVQNIGDSRVKIPTTKTQNPKIQQQQKTFKITKKCSFLSFCNFRIKLFNQTSPFHTISNSGGEEQTNTHMRTDTNAQTLHLIDKTS